MPTPKLLSCQTCRTTEVHTPLTPTQKVWLRGETGEKYVEQYFMCAKDRPDGTPCRNLRTYLTEKRFRRPLRMPDEVD
ncbi:hypothetical protein [Streptomyces sp. NPDC002845]